MSKKENEKDITLNVDQVPAEGALGLLALGDVGVKLWREARIKKRNEVITKQNQEKNQDEQEKG